MENNDSAAIVSEMRERAQDSCNPQQSSPDISDRRRENAVSDSESSHSVKNKQMNSTNGFMDLKTTFAIAQERLRAHLGASQKQHRAETQEPSSQDLQAWQADQSKLWPKQAPILSKQIFGQAQDFATNSLLQQQAKRQIPSQMSINQKNSSVLQLLNAYTTSSASGSDIDEADQNPESTPLSIPGKRTSQQAQLSLEYQNSEPKKQKRSPQFKTSLDTKEAAQVANQENSSKHSSEESSDYDSEEERRKEQEELEKDIVVHLRKKQEPLTMQQLAYQLDSKKKMIEQALETLIRSKSVIKRSLQRNSVVYYLPLIAMMPTADGQDISLRRVLDQVLTKLYKTQQILENDGDAGDQLESTSCLINTCQKPERESIDSKLLEVERNIKHVRATPSERDIRAQIDSVQDDLNQVKQSLGQVRARPDYLGKSGHRGIQKLQKQFTRQQHLYWLRKRACFDLIEVFSELKKEDKEVYKAKVGLSEEDFEDKDIQVQLDVYDEIKLGLDDAMDDQEDEESEDEYDDEEEQESAEQEEPDDCTLLNPSQHSFGFQPLQ